MGEKCSTENWQDYQIDTPWNTLNSHRWLRTTVTIPEEMDWKTCGNAVDFGKRGTVGCDKSTDAFFISTKS